MIFPRCPIYVNRFEAQGDAWNLATLGCGI